MNYKTFIAWFVILIPLMGQVSLNYHQMYKLLFNKSAIVSNDSFPAPLSNAVTDIKIRDHTLYLGTGRGVSIYNTQTNNWINYDNTFFRGHGGISALNVAADGTIWVATAYDTIAAGTELSAGGGLFYLHPDSNEWKWIPQPVDQQEDSALPNIDLPVVTNIQNVTFDIEFLNSEIWIASWGGGIRKSNDNGKTWQVITPDGQPFNVLSNLDQRGFSLLQENGNMWVGTAEGIAKSVDGGVSWEMFKASPSENSISGNWCIELKYQPTTGWIWAATIKTFAENEYEFTGISATSDGGLTWKTFLREELSDGSFPRYIDFIGDTVIVATENGVYVSSDLGNSWNKLGYIVDKNNGEKLLTEVFYSVGIESFPDHFTCWIGSDDGLAYTSDFWEYHIIRRFEPITESSKIKTFAYPNPFSPKHGDMIRIQFLADNSGPVTVTIYNQAMEKVIEIEENVTNVVQPVNRYVVWDGKAADLKEVPNGLYFYKLKFNGKIYWGKILVVN